MTRPSGPTLTELSGDEQSVAQAQARRARLLVVASQLKQMRHAVEIAGSNMYAAGTADGGLFDDDRRLYDWFTAQLADDASLSQATGERAREVDTLADAAVRRRLLALQERERESRELAHEQERRTTEDAQRRRDRINFAQAAVVGAVLLALAAIQSFDYKKVVPEPGRPAVIAMLTALAVWLSVLTLLLTGPRRPLVRWVSPLFHLMVNPGERPPPKNAHAVGAVLEATPPPPFRPLTQPFWAARHPLPVVAGM